MPKVNINRRVVLSSSVVFSSEANALFAQWDSLGTPASFTRKVTVNNTILGLKSQGIWDELDCLYVWAAHSKLAGCVDWKNPSTRSATLNSDYAGSFVADNYMVSNGTFWVDTNFNPGNGGTYKFTRDGNSFGFYCKDTNNITANVIDLSATTASNNGNELFFTSNFGISGNDNNTVNRTGVSLTQVGLAMVKRTGASAWEYQHDGYDQYSNTAKNTDASIAIPNLSFYQCCRNVNGTRSLFSQKRYCYTFFGSNLIDGFILNDVINKNYLTPLSLNVPKRITFNGNSYTANVAYPRRVLSNINTPNVIATNWRGVSGQTTVQMQSDAVTKVFDKYTTAYSKDVLFAWELTNDMAANSSNVTTCYNNIVNYCIAARLAMPNVKIIIATMLPRNGAVINNANRQNDSNLLDDTTLNGKIRNHLVQDGYADAICDVASDPTMGIYSNGVAGVGEKNTTYYNVDEIHPTTAGYNLLADTYITPSINAFL